MVWVGQLLVLMGLIQVFDLSVELFLKLLEGFVAELYPYVLLDYNKGVDIVSIYRKDICIAFYQTS